MSCIEVHVNSQQHFLWKSQNRVHTREQPHVIIFTSLGLTSDLYMNTTTPDTNSKTIIDPSRNMYCKIKTCRSHFNEILYIYYASVCHSMTSAEQNPVRVANATWHQILTVCRRISNESFLTIPRAPNAPTMIAIAPTPMNK